MANSATEKLSKPLTGKSGIQGHWIGEKQNGRPGKRRVGAVPFSRDVVELQFVRALLDYTCSILICSARFRASLPHLCDLPATSLMKMKIRIL